MNQKALFIRHQARPGKRDDVRRVWEKFVKPRAAANPGHEAYYYCYDRNDADVICVFQLYQDLEALDSFSKDGWYAEYLNEVSQFVSVPPQITPADLIWQKPTDRH